MPGVGAGDSPLPEPPVLPTVVPAPTGAEPSAGAAATDPVPPVASDPEVADVEAPELDAAPDAPPELPAAPAPAPAPAPAAALAPPVATAAAAAATLAFCPSPPSWPCWLPAPCPSPPSWPCCTPAPSVSPYAAWSAALLTVCPIGPPSVGEEAADTTDFTVSPTVWAPATTAPRIWETIEATASSPRKLKSL